MPPQPLQAFDLWRTPEGRSKGVGSVVFKKAAEAHAAVSELNGAEVDGRIISVEIESGGTDWELAGGANSVLRGDLSAPRTALATLRQASDQSSRRARQQRAQP